MHLLDIYSLLRNVLGAREQMKVGYINPALEESSRPQPQFNMKGSSKGLDCGLLTGRGKPHLLCPGVSQQILGGAELELRVLQADRRWEGHAKWRE